jgi:hypothetical protein
LYTIVVVYVFTRVNVRVTFPSAIRLYEMKPNLESSVLKYILLEGRGGVAALKNVLCHRVSYLCIYFWDRVLPCIEAGLELGNSSCLSLLSAEILQVCTMMPQQILLLCQPVAYFWCQELLHNKVYSSHLCECSVLFAPFNSWFSFKTPASLILKRACCF